MHTVLFVKELDDQVADDAYNTFQMLLVTNYFFTLLLYKVLDVFSDFVREKHFASSFDCDLPDLLVWWI